MLIEVVGHENRLKECESAVDAFNSCTSITTNVVFAWGKGSCWGTNSTEYCKEQISKPQKYLQVSWYFYCLMDAVASGPLFIVKRHCPSRLYQNSEVLSILKIVSTQVFHISTFCSQQNSHHTLFLQESSLIWGLTAHMLEHLLLERKKWEAEWMPKGSPERETYINFQSKRGEPKPTWAKGGYVTIDNHLSCLCPLWVGTNRAKELWGSKMWNQDSDRGLLFLSTKDFCAQIQWITGFSVNQCLKSQIWTLKKKKKTLAWKLILYLPN